MQAARAAAADARRNGVPAVTNNGDAASRQGGVCTGDGPMAGLNGRPSSSKGAPTANKSGCSTADSADGVAPATVANGTGLYQSRTSGRSIGGSLKKRFTDDQVSAALVGFATIAMVWREHATSLSQGSHCTPVLKQPHFSKSRDDTRPLQRRLCCYCSMRSPWCLAKHSNVLGNCLCL